MANRNAKLIERTLKDFSLGAMSGSGGSVIVDALPAQGVEGTTYLLRKKEEGEVFKAHGYKLLYSKQGWWEFGSFLIMIDPDFDLLEKDITTKLNPDLSEGEVNFDSIANIKAGDVSSQNWNNFIENNNVVIVATEEDVLNITEDVDYIVQDLGEIGIENLGYIEFAITDSETYLAGMHTWLNTLTHRIIKQNDKMVDEEREVIFNSELEPGQTPYSFTEWQEQIGGAVVGTLTDTYEYDHDTLMDLGEDDCYFITLTPSVPEVTYSYTQYVFDQGVYTVLGDGGNKLFTVQIKGRTNDYTNYPISITAQVETNELTNLDDLKTYLEEKGYIFYFSSGEGSGFVLQATGTCSNYAITGIYAEYSDVKVICSNESKYPLRSDELEIIYLD